VLVVVVVVVVGVGEGLVNPMCVCGGGGGRYPPVIVLSRWMSSLPGFKEMTFGMGILIQAHACMEEVMEG